MGNKDPAIIVDRGRSQCGAISNLPNDRVKLIEHTNTRFSAPAYPSGFGLQTAAKMRPTYPMTTA